MGVLEVHNVSIRYLTGDFKDIGLKEYVMKKLKGQYQVTEFWADRNVSFTLDRGEMLGIIGTNGAGKSTLLKAVSGIMEPTEGYVERRGNIAALLELASGFDGDLTVRENAYLRGAMLGYTRSFMEEKYDEIIDFAELRDFQDRPFRQLSSGMKSRLAFSIASLVQPDILILDEVLSVGDGAFRTKSEAKMKEIIAGGAATILVSHSLQQVRTLCTKVLWLEKGEQIALGDTETLCDLYQQYLDHKLTLEQVKRTLGTHGPAAEEKPAVAEEKPTAKTPAPNAPEARGEGAAKGTHPVSGGGGEKGSAPTLAHRTRSGRDAGLLLYTGLFFLAFLLAYSPFLLEGRSMIWNVDGRNQHYPALIYVGRYLRQIVLNLLHGEFSIPLFDLNLAMGGDVIATLNYYGFGNPLYLLSAFVPTHYTEYLYSALVVVRLYLAGLAFWALCAHHKKENSYALMGALIYVFSGYAIYSTARHPYFIEPMIQLPLLLIGIELVIRRKKPFLFIATVCYSALCGFYFLWMMTIMLGIYTLFYFFDWCRENRVREFFRMAGRIIGTYLLGIGLAAPFFLPSVVGFLTSGRTGGSAARNYFSYGFNYYRNAFFNLIAPPGSWDDLALSALIVPAVVVLLFFSKGRRKRLKGLLAVCAAFYILPLGGYIMNGFSFPSRRWTFGLALLLAYVVVETLPELLEMDRKRQLACFGAFLLYAFAVFSKEEHWTAAHVVGVSLLGGTLLVLYLFGASAGGWKKLGALACALLIVVNVGINGSYRFSESHGNDIGAFAEYATETTRLETALEREAEPYLSLRDGRFDSSMFLRNIGVVWRVPAPNIYWSVTNESALDLWKETENSEIKNGLHNIYGSDQRTIFDTLLSVKYCIENEGRENHVPYGYTALEKTWKGNWIYENQYALPWGYTYDSYLPVQAAETMNGLEREEAMLQSILLEETPAGIEQGEAESDILEIPYEVTGENIEWADGTLTVQKDKATMTLAFQTPAHTEVYVRLEGMDITASGRSEMDVTAKCEDISQAILLTSTTHNYFFGREDYLANLGYSDHERTSCEITFAKAGKYKLDNIRLMALPMDNYPQRVEALRAEPLENITFGTNRITGTVDLSKNKVLCVSVPYSAGWSAKVDGEEVKILRGNYMCMALPLSAGHHQIQFTYCTPGLRAGMIFCLLSATAVIYMVCRGKRKQGNSL